MKNCVSMFVILFNLYDQIFIKISMISSISINFYNLLNFFNKN